MKQELNSKVVTGVIAAIVVVLVIVLIAFLHKSAASNTADLRPGQAAPQSPAEVQARHQEVQEMRAEFKQEMADRRARMGRH